FDEGERQGQPAPVPVDAETVVQGRREAVEHVVIMVQRQADLFEVVGALGPAGGLASLLDGRHEQPDEDGNDGDDHQQLDQRERRPTERTVHDRLLPGASPAPAPVTQSALRQKAKGRLMLNRTMVFTCAPGRKGKTVCNPLDGTNWPGTGTNGRWS